jgi:hypothetical protein
VRRAGPRPCPQFRPVRAGGPRGSRAGRRPVPKGRAAPLRRGNAGPYQRPPPAKLTTKSAKDEDHRVALTARIRRSSTGTARSGASRPAAVFGAVGGMQPGGSRVNPDPAPGGGESPARATGVALLRREPGKQVSHMTPISGIGDRSAQTLPPQAQKAWACTRSRLGFPDRLADVRSAIPSKSFGVDVRMVQHVDRVERVRRRQPKPARRTGRERGAGPGACRRAWRLPPRPGSIPSSWSSTGSAS